MIYEYINNLIKSIDRLVRVRLLFLFTAILLVAISILFYTLGHINKGLLVISVKGTEGDVSIIVTKVGANSADKKNTTLKSREARIKLGAGRYKVQATLNKSGASEESVNSILSSEKEVEIARGSTQFLELNLVEARVLSVKNSADRPALVGMVDGDLLVTDVRGITNRYFLKDPSPKSVYAGDRQLTEVVARCSFDNGITIAVNRLGYVYKITSTDAELVDKARFSSAEVNFPELSYFSRLGLLESNTNFICLPDILIFAKTGYVSKDLNLERESVVKGLRDIHLSNYALSPSGDLWFYNKLDSDSFDIDSVVPADSKKITKLMADGTAKSIETDSYITSLSVIEEDGYCYYFKSKISCGKMSERSSSVVLELPDRKEITNMTLLDARRLVYTYENTAWVLDVDSGTSRQIYSSSFKILPKTISYDKNSKNLTFAAMSTSGGSTNYDERRLSSSPVSTIAYQLPIIDLSSFDID